MGGYQYGRGDSTDDDPRSAGQGGGGRRGYGAQGGGSRGYGASGYGREPGHHQQPPQAPPPQGGGRGAGAGRAGYGGGSAGGSSAGYDPYGGSPAPSAPSGGAGGGGRRGYGGGSRGRSAEPISGEIVRPDYSQPDYGPAGGYGSDPGSTRVQDAAELPGQRRSRLEERRAARGGEANDASQQRSDRYPESPLNGRSTRNGAAASARARAANGPVRRLGYHRYFDYPRTGLPGWRAWVPSIKQICGCTLAGLFLLLGLVAFEYETVQIPDEHSTVFAQSSFYDYSDGTTQFATDGNTNRTIVQYAEIPTMVQDAIVSQEDKTFWTNPGVSYTGTLRALAVDLMGDSTQGGSTITQQYVKNAYLTQAQTTSRKIDEIFISLKLSKMLDKQTILTAYLNTSPFGRNTSGVAAGAKAWFNLTLAQMKAEPIPLQASQAAFLAAMVNQPSTFSAGWDPTQSAATQAAAKAAALKRWSDTLANMHSYTYLPGHLTDAQYKQALADKPNPVPLTSAAGQSMQDVQMKQAAMNWLDSYNSAHPGDNGPSSKDIANGGYTVVTTFNQKYMQLAQQAMQSALLDHETAFDKNTLAPGLAAVDPATGDLVAFYGGTTYENTATLQTAQGGSTFKMFTLATALTNNWSPDSFVSGDPWPDKSNPTEVAEDQGDTSGGITNDGSHAKMGMITMQHALNDSVNTAFVRIEEQQPGQYQEVEKMAEAFGLSSSMATQASGCDNVRFTLGVCAVDPARMADAYSALPDNGTLHQLVEIKSIKEPGGTIWTPKDYTSQPVTSDVAATEVNMMTGVIHSSDGTANSSYQNSSLRMTNIAGKTGTSTLDITPDTTAAMQQNNYNDHNGQYDTAGIWFDGFSSKLAISVGISRWVKANVTVNGKVVQQTVQLPVDNIADQGNDYGAMYPFAAWANFMNAMQSTPFGGDQAFSAPQPNPSATVMNSPTPSPSATTPTATQTTPTATQTTPSATQTTPTDTATASPTSTSTCNNGFPFGCIGGGPTDTATATAPTPTASSTSTSKRGNGPGNGSTP